VAFGDAYGNNALVSSAESSPLSVAFETSSPLSGSFEITYSGRFASVTYTFLGTAPTSPSIAIISVKIANVHVAGSPFHVTVSLSDSVASPLNTTIFYADKGLLAFSPFGVVATAGQPVELILKGRSMIGADAPLFKNLVSFLPSLVNLVTVAAPPETSGVTLRYSITVTQSGIYPVTIRYNAVTLIASPVTFTLIPSSIFAPLGVVEGVATAMNPTVPVITAGSAATLNIFARDAYGNSRARDGQAGFGSNVSHVSAYLKSPTVADSTFVALAPAITDDRIVGTYIATVAAEYSVFVFLNNLPFGPGLLQPGVYKIAVRPSSIIPSACSLSGSGLSIATVGRFNSFYVISRDQFFNVISDASDATTSTFAAVVEHNLGAVPRQSYSSGFDIGARLQRLVMMVTIAGTYSVQVSLGGAAAFSCPIKNLSSHFPQFLALCFLLSR